MKKKLPWEVRNGNPLLAGVTRTARGFQFTLRVPEGQEASLLIYKKGAGKPFCEIELPEEARTGEVSAVVLEPMEPEVWEYNYRIGGKVCRDPYARQLAGCGKFGVPVTEPGLEHKVRCALPAEPQMETEPLEIPYTETVLYKTHVRGFTKQRDSHVKKKGTFAGVEEKIDYLKSLGVTAVEFMPVYEFCEFPEKCEEGESWKKKPGSETQETSQQRVNYWGYGPALYFAPKAAFCHSDAPVQEFAGLVDRLHGAGLECILEFYFEPEHAPGFVLDVLHYWQRTFRVDGFHLLGSGAWAEAAARDALLKKTKLIFLGMDTQQLYGNAKRPYYRNLGEHNLGFQSDMRRFLKGDDGSLEGALYRMRRNPEQCAVINFFADHDGFTMADMVAYEQKHNDANGEENRDGSDWNYTWNCGTEGPTRRHRVLALRERQLRNAWLMLMTSQGTPMIYGGDEFCNSNGGNNNPYCQDNETGWLCWKETKESRRMLEFVRQCVAFRRKHPVLHMEKEPKLVDYKAFGCPDLSYHSQRAWYGDTGYAVRCAGAMYCGAYAADQNRQGDVFIYIAYNMHWEEHALALPTLPRRRVWSLAADTGREECFCAEGEEQPLADQRRLVVPPRTVMILTGRLQDGSQEAEHTEQAAKREAQAAPLAADRKREQNPEAKAPEEKKTVSPEKRITQADGVKEAHEHLEAF